MMKTLSDLPLDLSSGLAEKLASEGAIVRVGFPLWLRFVLSRGVEAITLGRRIYVAPRSLDTSQNFERLLRHELIHLRQWRDHGMARFILRYVRDYVRLRRSGLGPRAAYLSIPFEEEARLGETNREAEMLRDRKVL